MVKIIELTEQNKNKLTRFIEYNAKNMFNIINDRDIVCDENGMDWKCNEFTINLAMTYDDDDDEVYIISVSLDKQILFIFTMLNYHFMEDKIIEKFIRELTLYKTKKICDCDVFITNNKFDVCSHCYVNATTHDQNCPICFETGDGVWVKNKSCQCISYYHYICLKNVKKCPTCRCDMKGFSYL